MKKSILFITIFMSALAIGCSRKQEVSIVDTTSQEFSSQAEEPIVSAIPLEIDTLLELSLIHIYFRPVNMDTKRI